MSILHSLEQLDINLFLYLNSFHTTFWDYCMMLFTRKETWAIFYLTIFITIGVNYRKKSLLIFLLLTLVIVFCDQGAGLMKDFFMRFRPSQDPEISQIAHNFFKKGGLYGFVSAHAANAFGFALFSSLLFKNYNYNLFVFPFAITIAYSRVYLGVHYPADIFFGGLYGMLVGWGAYKAFLYGTKFFPSSEKSNTTLSNRAVSYPILAATFTFLVCIITVHLFMKYNMLH